MIVVCHKLDTLILSFAIMIFVFDIVVSDIFGPSVYTFFCKIIECCSNFRNDYSLKLTSQVINVQENLWTIIPKKQRGSSLPDLSELGQLLITKKLTVFQYCSLSKSIYVISLYQCVFEV